MAEELAVPGSTDVAVHTGSSVDGLEDFDSTKDASMPMIRIDHNEGVFTDSLSGEAIGAEMEVILLGLVKQRVLWPPEVTEEKSAPLCKSYDFNTGHPNAETFPVKAAGIPGLTRDALEDEEINTILQCGNCQLKEWGSHPKRDTPWCTAQYTFPLLTRVGDPSEGLWAPAVLTVQRTAIKPANAYLTSFERAAQPLYTTTTVIKLEHRSRGTVDFAVPKFIKGTGTDNEEWGDYSATFKGIRGFLQTPRVRDDEEGTAVSVNTPAAAPEATAAPAAAPAPAPEAAPAAEAAPAPAAAEPAPAAEAAPAPAPAAAPAAAAGDDLPF